MTLPLRGAGAGPARTAQGTPGLGAGQAAVFELELAVDEHVLDTLGE